MFRSFIAVLLFSAPLYADEIVVEEDQLPLQAVGQAEEEEDLADRRDRDDGNTLYDQNKRSLEAQRERYIRHLREKQKRASTGEKRGECKSCRYR